MQIEVEVQGGRIRGSRTADGVVAAFKGVPFARPPVGDLRWRAPQPALPWSGTRAAVEFGPSAIQAPPPPGSIWPPASIQGPPSIYNQIYQATRPTSEDCLYLNVWTAAAAAKERRPVMVWIHGGGWRVGEGSHPTYDGEALARKGVVLVTINYRLWRFGCLAHPELSREADYGTSGNYGLLDQLAALRWVQANIAAFGGDADRVTIFGQSVGSVCVNALMASPLSKGLFSGAIGQSGAEMNAVLKSANPKEALTLADAEVAGEAFLAALGVTSIAGARARPTADIVDMPAQVGIDPARQIVDGYVLPEPIGDIFAAGRQNDVPLLVGFATDEWTTFSGTPDTEEALWAYAGQSGDADAFLALYRDGRSTPKSALQDVLKDKQFWWQVWSWARLQRSTGAAPVFVYQFDHAPALPLPTYYEGEATALGAFHGSEMPYVFGNLDGPTSANGPVDRTLSNAVSSYWLAFAAAGDPNVPGLAPWPAFDGNTGPVLRLGPVIESSECSRLQQLHFWDRYLASRPSA